MRLNFTGPAAAYLARRLNLSASEEEVIRYGLQVVVYAAANLAAVTLAGWLAGALASTLTASLAAASLRLFSGGAHSRSPVTCALLGAAVASLVGRAAETLASLLGIFGVRVLLAAGLVPAAVTVWRLAPVDSPAKPIVSFARRGKLRRLSLAALFALAAAALALASRWPVLALAAGGGTWWQAFTLTRAGHQLAAAVDKLARGRR